MESPSQEIGRIGAPAIPIYEPDHTYLLQPLNRSPLVTRYATTTRVDALAVPASRPSGSLRTAAEVARASARILIVLCSGDCDPADVRSFLRARRLPVPVLVVDMDGFQCQRCETLKLASPRWSGRDTALKRNAALLFARRLGLRHVLFLDDDVARINPRDVTAGVAAMERGAHRAAGWDFPAFPDNSAVSHAYRMAGGRYGRQTCFVGGGGVMVAVDEHVPHFPPGIYNEDWFFLYPLLAERGVARIGSLWQQPYDPFKPEVAAEQEFGDLLAEGMLSHLGRFRGQQGGVEGRIVDPGFWSVQIERRRRFLVELRRDLERCVPRAASDCVEQSEQASRGITVQLVSAWLSAWNRDRTCWSDLVGGVEQGPGSVDEDDLRRLVEWSRALNFGEQRVTYRLPELVDA